MFRRKTETPTTDDPSPASTGGKGRPTPKRREVEAANRARAKKPRGRREQSATQRAARTESSRKMRQAMKTGDERYLPPRDKGPVRRFVRDFVDTRFSFVELLVPIMVLTLVMGYSGSTYLVSVANLVLLMTMLLVFVDLLVLRFRVRREVTRRFPDEPLKGVTYYAVIRALQMKFMRLPKAQVKIGQKLPETYR